MDLKIRGIIDLVFLVGKRKQNIGALVLVGKHVRGMFLVGKLGDYLEGTMERKKNFPKLWVVITN